MGRTACQWLMLLVPALTSTAALAAPEAPTTEALPASEAEEPAAAEVQEPSSEPPPAPSGAEPNEPEAALSTSESESEQDSFEPSSSEDPHREAKDPPPAQVGSQQDDRAPIEEGFGKRWIATPTVSSNPKLATSFGATGIVFFRFDDSIASTGAVGGAYSVTNSWTAFLFGKIGSA